ncbi:hypothetical protein [Variovorax guangxiensis]|uniref:hypothetical protein n=1 Tax=Variovorax guangxiensis TaxID=1775474 RepID=UPI0028666B1F|nr:hypothetical protein [Variovorax guangxiensis]MDR6860705.1 hypothetical protein [Variovorax guangxiensis]
MGVRVKTGDLFCVPLDDAAFGLGIIAAGWRPELYIVLFAETVASPQAADVNTASLTPLLASSSLDAKLFVGDWPILRRGTDSAAFSQPIYKVEEPDGTIAESFDRKLRIPISANVAERLQYRKGVAPVRLEKALKAHHGFGEWLAHFDELLYINVLRSNTVLTESGLLPTVRSN